MLDGGAPSTDFKECYKRREYLIINEFNDDQVGSFKPANDDNATIEKEAESVNNINNAATGNKNKRIYCGNWNKLKKENNDTSNDTTTKIVLPKTLHFVGNSQTESQDQNNNLGFHILYVVRSAMPPVMNDGKRLQQQHGFKVKVGLHNIHYKRTLISLNGKVCFIFLKHPVETPKTKTGVVLCTKAL